MAADTFRRLGSLMVMTVILGGCSQGGRELLRGDWATARGDGRQAMEHYRNAMSAGTGRVDVDAALAAGVACYEQGQFQDAADAFAVATRLLVEAAPRSAAYHDLGNALAMAGRHAEALDAYRAALRLRSDEDTRYNFALVRRWRDRSAPDSPAVAPMTREEARRILDSTPDEYRPAPAKRLPRKSGANW